MDYVLKSKYKKVFKKLIKLWDKRGDLIGFPSEDKLRKDYFSNQYTEVDFHHCLSILKDFNFISCLYGSGKMLLIKVTPIGEAYFPTIRHENRKVLLNGILFPVIVAFITSIITALVTVLLTR